MDAAGIVDLRARLLQLADELLDDDDVLIDTDGRYHFYRIGPANRVAAAIFSLNRGIFDQYPLPVLLIPHRIGIVDPACMKRCGMKITGDHPGGCRPCDAGHLNFDSKSLGPQ